MSELNLVEVMNNEVVTTSRQVAEAFEKEHGNVLKKIEKIIKNLNHLDPKLKITAGKVYYKTTYKDAQGQERPMYIMNRDGFTKLAMGFTGDKAEHFQWKYIEQFNAMEKKLKEQRNLSTPSYQIEDPVKRAERWIEEEKERQGLLATVDKQSQQLAEYEPKATYYDKVLKSKGLVKIGVIASDYGMSAIKMNQLLHKLKIQYKQGRIWLLYTQYRDKGYTKTTTTKDGYVHMKWTQQGRLFIYDTLKQHGILPLMERDENE